MDLAVLQAEAREKLDPLVYDYYSGGADEESTLSDNVAAWQRYRMRPHVLRDVSSVDISTEVLGTKVSMPVLVAPTGYHMLSHPEGEAASARGTAAAGTLMTVSTLATVSLEGVAAAAPGAPRW
ncbi:MAG: alpha-hydroxy-acid oxidizing protein, partial [Acidimicrobiia bacterium]|nr:alpha-hydroxy-acid oxidizing protein [Acidimicrobiia bacterium]